MGVLTSKTTPTSKATKMERGSKSIDLQIAFRLFLKLRLKLKVSSLSNKKGPPQRQSSFIIKQVPKGQVPKDRSLISIQRKARKPYPS